MTTKETGTDGGNTPAAEVIAANKVVAFHYQLCEVDGAGDRGPWLEKSHDREPLYYLHGFHNVIVGLENAMAGKSVGDCIEITLNPEQAYGPLRPNAVQRVPLKHIGLPKGQRKPIPGMIVTVRTEQGMKQVIVRKCGKFNVDVDFNHPYAGKVLFYKVDIVAIRDASAEEISHGHVHGPGGHKH